MGRVFGAPMTLVGAGRRATIASTFFPAAENILKPTTRTETDGPYDFSDSPEEPTRTHGGRTDQSGRACVRHFFAAAEGQHHLHRHANRRSDCQSGHRADAV